MDNNCTNNDFKVPEGYFDRSRERLMKSIQMEEFNVPEGYFEVSKSEIINKIACQSRASSSKGRVFRMVLYVTSAAAVLVLGVVLFKNEPQPPAAKPTFAELIEQTEIDEALVFEDATSEDILEYFGHELISIDADTAVVRPEKTKKEKIQNKIKRKENSKTPSIDDVSEDDIIKYLLEEGGEDEF
ncbi:MAG: hypothetical protein ACOYLH_08390 [Flavobacteriales bacterium]